MELFRLYTFIDGMPEAIARHKETKDFVQTVTVYETLFSFLKTMLQKAFLAMKKFALLRYAYYPSYIYCKPK